MNNSSAARVYLEADNINDFLKTLEEMNEYKYLQNYIRRDE